MIGQVMQWNPDVPPTMVKSWINEAYRDVIDRRRWAGLKVRGQLITPNLTTAGTISINQGDTVVNGTGTAWTQDLVGQQLRSGFSTGFFNIQSVQSATQLTLDMPWGNPTIVTAGYSIFYTWVNLGPNIKVIHTMVNQRQGYRMITGIPQEFLNRRDTWRTATGWSWGISPKELSFNGSPLFEIYPAPTFQQCFPYLAYIQPPDLNGDQDYPVAFIASDLLVLRPIANALVFRGPKLNPYYDPTTASGKLREFGSRIETMTNADDAMDPKDLQYDDFPMANPGASWAQNHDEGGW